MRTRRLALFAALAGLVLAGCSSGPVTPVEGAASSRPPSVRPAPQPTFSVAPGAPMPRAVPSAPGLVATRQAASVERDADGRSTLCFGVVLAMVGASCRGPELIGFDQTGADVGPVRVVGRFDGTRFTVTDTLAPDPAVAADDVAARLRTPCPVPDGGWRVTDPAKATGTAAGRALRVAHQQPGFAQFWYDRSVDTVPSVVNVAVAGDRDAAEAALREVWGGALCVTGARYSQRDLKRVATEVFGLPGADTAAVRLDEVAVEVLYDDGSLQAWADATYGPGLVRITSALVPLT